MSSITVKLICPKCGLDGSAIVKEVSKNCLVYVCPKCKSNVACYNDKIDIISTDLLKKLIKRGKLRFCGRAKFVSNKNSENATIERVNPITEDDVRNLRILLETESDSSCIISQL